MEKEFGKTIVIQDDTLSGKFPTGKYQNCTFVFKNCTFLNFEFSSTKNSIELSSGNRLCEKIVLDASKVIMKSFVDTENLDSLSINGGYFKMPEGAKIKASGDISIVSNIQSFKKNRIESLSSLILQSREGTTTYKDCTLIGKYGVKISALHGDLRMEHTKIQVTDAEVRTFEEDRLNGIYLSCYGTGAHMYLLDNTIETDVLEITHPNHMICENTEVKKIKEYGRILSRNHEQKAQVISYNYIEAEFKLDPFYHNEEPEKRNKSKILGLFGFSKKSA